MTYPIEKVGEEFRILKIPREKICRKLITGSKYGG